MNSETPSLHWSPRHLENEINSSIMGKYEFMLLNISPRLCEGEVSKTSSSDRRSRLFPRVKGQGYMGNAYEKLLCV